VRFFQKDPTHFNVLHEPILPILPHLLHELLLQCVKAFSEAEDRNPKTMKKDAAEDKKTTANLTTHNKSWFLVLTS